MSQIAATHATTREPHAVVLPPARVDHDAVHFPPGAGRTASLALGVAGAALAILCLALAAAGIHAKQAMLAYLIGFVLSLGVSLGSLGLVMILQQFNAGWTATLRRQLEVVASLIWVPALLFIPLVASTFISPGLIWSWMGVAPGADPVLGAKAGFLNMEFFWLRQALYFLIWILLARSLYRSSRLQDSTGDRWLTARARRVSSYGLLLYALTTAFASFDWLMALDYHWFSTMFGVWFFAGNTLSAVALLIIISAILRAKGKLRGLVTIEHNHDLGKLLIAFTIFWAYISFSQYFLIWYGNIPEETAWFLVRKQGAWYYAGIVLCFGHFLLPFLILLWRGIKKNPATLVFFACWQLLMHVVDVAFVIRPTAKATPLGANIWLDLVGIAGPVLIFLAFVTRRVCSVPLVPLHDPRMVESLEHKNYV